MGNSCNGSVHKWEFRTYPITRCYDTTMCQSSGACWSCDTWSFWRCRAEPSSSNLRPSHVIIAKFDISARSPVERLAVHFTQFSSGLDRFRFICNCHAWLKAKFGVCSYDEIWRRRSFGGVLSVDVMRTSTSVPSLMSIPRVASNGCSFSI